MKEWLFDFWLYNLRRSPDVFAAHKLRKGKWLPVKLRINAFSVERLDLATGVGSFCCTGGSIVQDVYRNLTESKICGDPGYLQFQCLLRPLAFMIRRCPSPKIFLGYSTEHIHCPGSTQLILTTLVRRDSVAA